MPRPYGRPRVDRVQHRLVDAHERAVAGAGREPADGTDVPLRALREAVRLRARRDGRAARHEGAVAARSVVVDEEDVAVARGVVVRVARVEFDDLGSLAGLAGLEARHAGVGQL